MYVDPNPDEPLVGKPCAITFRGDDCTDAVDNIERWMSEYRQQKKSTKAFERVIKFQTMSPEQRMELAKKRASLLNKQALGMVRKSAQLEQGTVGTLPQETIFSTALDLQIQEATREARYLESATQRLMTQAQQLLRINDNLREQAREIETERRVLEQELASAILSNRMLQSQVETLKEESAVMPVLQERIDGLEKDNRRLHDQNLGLARGILPLQERQRVLQRENEILRAEQRQQ